MHGVILHGKLKDSRISKCLKYTIDLYLNVDLFSENNTGHIIMEIISFPK